MTTRHAIGLACAVLALGTSGAFAKCEGSYGRGWAKGQGAGEFAMRAADKTCAMGYTNFIDDAAKTKTPATDVALTKPPKHGAIGLSKQGVVYTPEPGFTGTDKFCMRSTHKDYPGKKLSGCVSVQVN